MARILLMSDSLCIPTGLARVGKELAFGLQRHGHQVGYLGWFHQPAIQPPDGIPFWFSSNNVYGEDSFDGVIQQFRPDIVLTIGDLWNLSYIPHSRTRKYFQWASYIAVDGEPIGGGLPPAIIPVIEDIDIPIAYTNYAKEAILKSVSDQETRNRIEVVYHGVDTNTFKPDPKARKELRERFGLQDAFIFLTVSRNQSRKNIPEIFRAWKIFSELPENKGKVVLFPHMNFRDSMGWNLDDFMQIIDLKNRSVMYYDQVAHGDSPLRLVPDEELAKLYQIADAFIMLGGEGFGLPTFEAMATQVPCILLNYAASTELGAEGRAHLIDVEGSITWTGTHLTQRPVPTVSRIVEAMVKVKGDKTYRDSIAQKGYEFAVQYPWQKISSQFNHIFTRMEIPWIDEVKTEIVA